MRFIHCAAAFAWLCMCQDARANFHITASTPEFLSNMACATNVVCNCRKLIGRPLTNATLLPICLRKRVDQCYSARRRFLSFPLCMHQFHVLVPYHYHGCRSLSGILYLVPHLRLQPLEIRYLMLVVNTNRFNHDAREPVCDSRCWTDTEA